MTNREFMNTLNDEDFENTMHKIYFGRFITKNRSPSYVDVLSWLKEPVDKTAEIWKDAIST